MKYSHRNIFLIPELIANDGLRKTLANDELHISLQEIQDRRSAGNLYDPEIHRQDMLDDIFQIACNRKWPRTVLFTTAYIFDSFAVGFDIETRDIDLCAVVALSLASKLETEFNENTTATAMMTAAGFDQGDGEAYTLVEKHMLEFFDYRLRINHPYVLWDLLRVHLRMRGMIIRDFTRFLIDCCTMDHRFINESPSCIVATSLWLSMNILNMKWTRNMSQLTGFTPDDLRAPVDALMDKLSHVQRTSSLYLEWSRYRQEEHVEGQLVAEIESMGTNSRREIGPEIYIHPSEHILEWIERHHRPIF